MANRKNPVQSSEDNGQFVKKRHPNTGEKNTCGIFFGYFQCYLMLLAAKVRHNDIYYIHVKTAIQKGDHESLVIS